ncbi:hypothetical protein [Hyphomonas sp. UBA4494]|uniref:hypothetical protein n=1 Tax=Hyphomonas sp. UBA4494 TaxID=1946631 RepID=UPI0025C36223|nr:hypothetical protein [Hyphomonas sp. UBA4494]
MTFQYEPNDPLLRAYEWGLFGIDPVVIPTPTPTVTETDASGSVVSAGATDDASTLKYKRSGIVDIAWQGEPWRVAWAPRSDGQLLGMTYRRDQGVLAWHRHPMTNGAVERVATIPNPSTGRGQVWMMVQRVIDGETVRYIEYMTEPHEPTTPNDTADYNFLDCSLTYSGSAVTEISNLDHLEGQSVQIWADGSRHDDKTVSGGSITLDREASKVHVGIHTAAYILTLPVDAASAVGTSQGKTKMIGRAAVRFVQTVGGKIGQTLDTLETILKRQASDVQGAPVALRSGIFKMNFQSAHDTDPQFYVVQDIPAPMTITALVPETDGADF